MVERRAYELMAGAPLRRSILGLFLCDTPKKKHGVALCLTSPALFAIGNFSKISIDWGAGIAINCAIVCAPIACEFERLQ